MYAIERYASYKASCSVKEKSVIIAKTIGNILYLLWDMPEIKDSEISEITSELWHEAVNNHRKRNKLKWYMICGSSGYKGKHRDLVRCLVFEKFNYNCIYCGRGLDSNILLQLDHLIPKSSKIGSNDLDNLVCSCGFCNYAKQATDENVFKHILIEVAKAVRKKYPNEFE